MENSGYTRRDGLVYYELIRHLGPDQANLLEELGGRIIPPGLWGDMAGMECEKQIIDGASSTRLGHPGSGALRRQPTQGGDPVRAAEPGELQLLPGDFVAAGAAVRKTVPVPAGGDRHRRTRRLPAQGPSPSAELDELVLFIDEIGGDHHRAVGASPPNWASPTNCSNSSRPFASDGRSLLVCATNAVHSLDSAFLRRALRLRHPGRPAGDQPARPGGVRYLGAANGNVDVDQFGFTASELFTPADIGFAARKARADRTGDARWSWSAGGYRGLSDGNRQIRPLSPRPCWRVRTREERIRRL